MGDLSTLSLDDKSSYEPTPFGKEILKKHFLFDQGFSNMNHGSFGTIPRAVRKKCIQFGDQYEARPDPFIRYKYPALLDESREAVSKILNVPVSTVVFIPNATTGTNTVIRNMVWNPDGNDEILYFSSVYGALSKTIEYECENTKDAVNTRCILVEYPIEDDEVITKFKETIATSRAAGKNPRIGIFDTVASQPGVRCPFEALTAVCRDENMLSIIDGAHGIGHVKLDLSAVDPDFFVSNCHKWLYAPRGCAVFYVPLRNQPLIRSTVPTSHGYKPRPGRSDSHNPLPASTKSEFEENFEFVGTLDNSPYCCVAEAVRWRKEVCGGEDKIIEYCTNLAKEGGKKVAKILGTEVLDNKSNTLTDCCMTNILLPLNLGAPVEGKNSVKPEHISDASDWMLQTQMDEFNTFVPITYLQGSLWVRISAQIYLDMEDFEWTGKILKEICERVGKGEYLSAGNKIAKTDVLLAAELAGE